MILEYMLVKEGRDIKAPSWVEDGGYFIDLDNKTLIGWTPNLEDRDYYVPDSVVVLSRATLFIRQKNIMQRYPVTKEDGTTLSDQEIENIINNWCDTRNEP